MAFEKTVWLIANGINIGKGTEYDWEETEDIKSDDTFDGPDIDPSTPKWKINFKSFSVDGLTDSQVKNAVKNVPGGYPIVIQDNNDIVTFTGGSKSSYKINRSAGGKKTIDISFEATDMV